MTVEVTYMSGAGNLFSVVDMRNYSFTEESLRKLAKILCNPNQFNGIRTEGLLTIFPSDHLSKADFEVKFHNPDGSSGMMCGNGGRCAIRFARKYGFTDNDIVSFSLAETTYFGNYGEIIDIYFPPPIIINEKITVRIDDSENKEYLGYQINVGTSHFVVYIDVADYDEFRKFEVEKYGRALRYNKVSGDDGTNVNFYYSWNGKLLIRTYERGVEAETGACGTGAIATVIAYSLDNKIRSTTELIPSSGQPLWVSIEYNSNSEIDKIKLSGNAEFIGSQTIALPENYMEL